MSDLTLRKLAKRYGDADAVRAIDLDVASGECVAVLGPSGAGKSTILRLIAGLETPTAGTVTLGGRDVSGVAAEHRGVSLMFQRPLLFPHLNALDNVAFSARAAGKPRKAARAHAEQYLELVQLERFRDRRATELSGGQAQRVALARALAAKPAVLLLDEPFSALDPQLRSEMHDLLRQVRAELSPTILLVTHDQHEASVLADRIAILLDGSIAQADAPYQIYTRPVSLAVHRMMGGLNEVPGFVERGSHISAAGNLRVTSADGPATLVFRHEAVTVTKPGDNGDLTGLVAHTHVIGARQRLHIRISGSDTLVYADAPPTLQFTVGARVALKIPPAARHVIPLSGEQAAET